MVIKKSLDELSIIQALISDVSDVNGLVFNTRSLRLTLKRVENRLAKEGLGFLTKTLPSLGKAFDKCLAGGPSLTCETVGQKPFGSTKLPRFLGELFSKVLDSDGSVLLNPDTNCIKGIRDICFLFYKYKVSYTDEQEQQVISKFERTEDDLTTVEASLPKMEDYASYVIRNCRSGLQNLGNEAGETPDSRRLRTTRTARSLLGKLFAGFDPLAIHPRHGPGAVATKQRLSSKYLWTNVSGRITDYYPLDAYFYASNGHVCDRYREMSHITDRDLPAKVILVPKDSRGPRLISCEPVDFQWVQQGLGRAIVALVEKHPLTRENVNFTHQSPNRCGAILGSQVGKYATLDLNEASDRVSTALVHLLFPGSLINYLMACRSSSTVLPDGRVLKLKKFAPMGSALCFPILALTVWAILTAGARDAYTRERILVYGDDVVVPTAYAAEAIEQLESFGLKINRDKSCTKGLFRESCGMDAYKGVDVTPSRLRTVWSSTPAADVYESYIAYCNAFHAKRYYRTYHLIVEELVRIYGPIPEKSQNISAPSLRFVPESSNRLPTRYNKALQKVQYKVWVTATPRKVQPIDGWSMLLRFFSEAGNEQPNQSARVLDDHDDRSRDIPRSAFSVGEYTERRTSYLVRRWR